MPDIPAKSVAVVHFWQASCLLCDWEGDPQNSYQEANTQRTAHLEEHRNA